MHIWATYVQMCTKYEVSMSNPVPGGGVHRHQCQRQHQCRMTMHDRQSMTVQGSLVDKPNEPMNQKLQIGPLMGTRG